MNTQSEALRLADALTGMVETADDWSDEQVNRAAAELRRLHEVNQGLLEALKWLLLFPNNPRENHRARAAIAKATGETHDRLEKTHRDGDGAGGWH
jgi:leucyl-tRNA synthetase